MRTFNAGDLFDKQYQLVSLLDTGGFADVWKAKHVSANNHIIALKIYPKLDEEGVKNIEMEYDVQKDLSHSNIITAKHFGKDENGYPYIVMRYCNLGNASIKVQKCNESEIAKIIQQVISGLTYLHDDENIVHQDIKPNNILIDEKDGKETYYLADLGLSLKVRTTIKKFTEHNRSRSNSLQTGVTPPPYRAPELWETENLYKPPIKATDIWAFGATLFELITGNVPFGDLGGLMQKNDPMPPDLPTEHNISDDLNIIIKRCLAKDTWDRPKAHELLQWANSYLSRGDWNIDNKSPNKSTWVFPVLKWIAIVLLGFMGAFVVTKALSPDPPIPDPVPSPTPSPTTTITIIPSPVTPTTTTTITPTTTIAPPPTTTIAPPKNERIVEYPNIVISKKTSSDIDITKIERTDNNLKVSFRLNRGDRSDESSYAIYGTENPYYAFYIRADGQEYPLKKMINGTNGESVKWGNRTSHTFTAVFEAIPDNIRVVDIMEAKERIEGQSYWNFKGVQLPQ